MKANKKYTLKEDNRAFAAQMGGMIALLVAIIVGVLVFYNVNDNLVFSQGSQTGAGEDSSVQAQRSAWNNTNSSASTVFTLLPIVAIVLIASIILGVVTSFGSKPGGGV